MSGSGGSAAIITVGSELTTGLRLDTNTREIASELARRGHTVTETLSIADDPERLSLAIRRLFEANNLVVVTGGLGPTHDDITREATSLALGLDLTEDPGLVARLAGVAERHTRPDAVRQVYVQAQVLDGARVIEATTGTAPGQVITVGEHVLALLPGPPHEMRPMLAEVLGTPDGPEAHVLRCAGLSESDAQITALEVLAAHSGIDLTVLASPWLVDVVLMPTGADETALQLAENEVADALGDAVYARDASTALADVVVSALDSRSLTVATAESCTGGLIAGALTDVPGASAVFRGSVIAYSNDVKTSLLGVGALTLHRHGAVSSQCAEDMVLGARRLLKVDIAVSTTGIAGPTGGSPDKPVGLVWFAIADESGVISWSQNLLGDRHGIRTRATLVALDGLRRRLQEC